MSYTFKNNILKRQFDYYKKTGLYKPDTYWTDLRVPLQSTKAGGSKDPAFVVFKNNGSSSQGVFLYSFSASQEQELYFAVQLPHEYKLGTDLHSHIHWVPNGDGLEGQKVSWGLEYTVSQIGGVFGNTLILSSNTHSPNDTTLLDNEHYVTGLGIIDGSNITTLSAMLVCRIFRDAAGALKDDTYGNTAFGLEVDFHYQKDTAGSKEELIK